MSTSTMDPCPFCSIAEENPPYTDSPTGTVFLSTDEVVAFLDIQPLVTSKAHILIIPRKHYTTLDKVDPQAAAQLGIALASVSKKLKEILPSVEAFNVVQNNGVMAGQVVHHVHFHIVIRGRDLSEPSNARTPYEKAFFEKISSAFKAQERLSYTALVYGKGQREDLDDELAADLVSQLRQCSNKL